MEKTNQYSDQELIKTLPGFTNHTVNVNGINLHYVEGGTGVALICLPGWPQTWYSFQKVAPQLAEKYKVIIVDIRGMGSSDKPESGYDKKTMAKDIFELMKKLGIKKANILGHDIGGMVAASFAFNHPEAIENLILMDGSHPSQGMMQMPLLPASGKFKEKMDAEHPFVWWMAFNQVKGLPEQLLEGRFRYLMDWLFNYVMIDDSKMSEFEREVAASHYNRPENIRASNAWYQTFNQDVQDMDTYNMPLEIPVLGIASYINYGQMMGGLPYMAKDVKVVGIQDSGHYLNEEKPQAVVDAVIDFIDSK